MVFDVPNSEGTYQQRYSILGAFPFSIPPISATLLLISILQKESYAANKPGKYVHLAPRHICTGTSHLESFFQDIIDQGGEGIILRDPTGIYEIGRSQGYLKHKVHYCTLPSFHMSFVALLSDQILHFFRDFVMQRPE